MRTYRNRCHTQHLWVLYYCSHRTTHDLGWRKKWRILNNLWQRKMETFQNIEQGFDRVLENQQKWTDKMCGNPRKALTVAYSADYTSGKGKTLIEWHSHRPKSPGNQGKALSIQCWLHIREGQNPHWMTFSLTQITRQSGQSTIPYSTLTWTFNQ